MAKEVVGNCKICGEPITRDMLTATDLDNEGRADYHESFGFACLKHAGVKDLFNQLIEKANEKLAQIQSQQKE